jgi:hypothetical protein
MNVNEKRKQLAQVLGWVFEGHGVWPPPGHKFAGTLMRTEIVPDPWLDAQDDYKVLDYMLYKQTNEQLKRKFILEASRLGDSVTSYHRGLFAEAALKVLKPL